MGSDAFMKALLIAAVLTAALVAVFVVWRRKTDTFKVLAPLKSPIGSEAADRATLDQLKKAGADLSKPTEVLFYLYLPDQALAMKAAERATTTNLSASVDRAAKGSSWLCLVKGEMVPALAAIHAETRRLEDIATSLGGEYDGWEAAVTR
jgi:hypothetical protein